MSITQAELVSTQELRSRGWSLSLINKLLGHPQRINHGPRPLKWYARKRVQRAERHPSFLAHLRLHNPTAPALLEREKDMLDKARSLPLEVPCFDRAALEQSALLHYQQRWQARGEYRTGNLEHTEFVERQTVNYLRHEMSHYEALLEQLSSRLLEDVRRALRERIYTATARTYPWLEGECKRQWGVRYPHHPYPEVL